MLYDGQIYNIVRLTVAEVELDDFGLAADQLLIDPLSLEMIQQDAEVSFTISMVDAVYSAVIPIPAAVSLVVRFRFDRAGRSGTPQAFLTPICHWC